MKIIILNILSQFDKIIQNSESERLLMGTIFKSLAYFRARVPDTTDISTTRATRVRHERHKCHTNDASATRVKNFHFNNDTMETYFHTLYLLYSK